MPGIRPSIGVHRLPFLSLTVVLLSVGLVVSQDCSNGCLRCSSNGICLLCDSVNFYVRNGYSCIQQPIQNCTVTLDGVTCDTCAQNMYYNTTLGNCVSIPTDQLRSFCLYYNSTGSCKQCNSTSYFPDSATGGCSPLTTIVPNCAIHSANGLCSQCIYPFYLSADNSTCLSVTVVPNCQLYSYEIACTQCAKGYNMQINSYQKDIQQVYASLLSFYQTMILSMYKNQTVSQNYINVCKLQVTNCSVVSPFNNCTNCTTGYFNNKGFCQLNPVEPIRNCVAYQNSAVCLQCQQNYYLSNNLCLAVTLIDNCLIYDVTKNKNCLQCSDGYYSSGANCVARLLSIPNCRVYSNTTDTCAQCSDSYWLAPNQLSCIPVQQFCLSPSFVSQGDGTYKANCAQCFNQFYIKTAIQGGTMVTSCLLPSQLIQGCLRYQQATLCVVCDNGYYLANFQCVPHDPVIMGMINCMTYSTGQLNQCAVCSSNKYAFKLLNYCAPVPNLLANCQTYNSSGICSVCNNGYYIALDSQNNVYCQKTNITSCIQTDVNTNTCIVCDPLTGTMPNKWAPNNLCISIPMSFTANCQSFSSNIQQSVANCVSCFSPYYPLLMNSVYFQSCYPYAEFQNLGNGISQSDISSLGTCLSFDLALKSCIMCDPNSITPMISSGTPGVCSQQCKWGDEVVLTFSFTGIYPSSFFQCSQVSLIHMFGDSSTNCQRADYDVSFKVTAISESNINQFCAQCMTNYIPVIANYTRNYYTHYDYLPMAAFNNRLASTSYFSPLIKRPIFASCKSWTTTFMTANSIPFDATGLFDSSLNPLGSYTSNSIYFVINWVNFQNCVIIIAEVQATGYNAYGCAQCAFQYTGPVITSLQGTNFIYNCMKMTTCDTSVYYSGIGSHDPNAMLYLYTSCHACTDKTLIVTISGVKPWSLPQDYTQTLTFNLQTLGYYPTNSCYMPGIISQNVQFFPANCQIQQVVPSQSLQQYTPTLSIPPNPACVACAPGFYPTISSILLPGQNYPFITACKQIENCDVSDTFNACDECSSGYVIMANNSAIGNTNGYPCVTNNIAGCQIGYQNGVCIKCLAGFTLNIYGFCDTVLMPKCTTFGNMTPYTSAYQYLTINPFPQGCLQCQTGTYSVRLSFPLTFCVQSNAGPTTAITPNFYIPNCLYNGLNINYQMTCTLCATGFSPTNTMSACIQRNLIQNCMTYSSTSTANSPICYQCSNGYYLQSNACYQGQIQNCVVYIDQFNCQQCATGFVATLAYFSTYIFCFDVSNSLQNCLAFDPNQAISGYLTCTQCSSNNYLITFGVPISTCSVYPIIPNCLTYDVQSTFTSSSFLCTLCAQPYYFIPGVFPSVCIPRTNYPILNCKNYVISLDTCAECIIGFYLTVDGLSCIQNPNGIIGCRIYTNVTYCSECDGTRNFFVSNGNCTVFDSGVGPVSNCWAYSPQGICLKCAPQYQYINSVCTKLTIQNCLVYGLDNVCLTCANGFILISNTCNQVAIANCQTYTSPTYCQTCQQGYYQNSGRCFQPAAISGCLNYASQNVCIECMNNYVLNPTGTACTPFTTAQALQVQNKNCYQFTPVRNCAYCKFGYYFDPSTGSCVACQSSPQGSCALCDYTNPSTCLICQNGYFMNNKSVCAKNINVTVVVQTVDDPNKDFYGFTNIIGSLIALILLH